MDEPSVLDYIKSKLFFWRGQKIEIPPAPVRVIQPPEPELKSLEVAEMPAATEQAFSWPESEENRPEGEENRPTGEDKSSAAVLQPSVLDESLSQALDNQASLAAELSMPAPEVVIAKAGAARWPVRTTAAVVAALFAQLALEPDARNVTVGIIGYAISAIFLIWAIVSKEWALAPLPEDVAVPVSVKINWKLLIPAIPLMAISFLAFSGNQFNAVNLILWAITIAYIFAVVWQPAKVKSLKDRLAAWIKKPEIQVKITPYVVLFALAIALVLFFRFYRLAEVPGEMFSDHAEKLLDVSDILNGKYSIFFPRNTGREAIQMYMSAALAILLNTGLSFITLKIGTVLCGVLTLPYVYLLGKEIGGKWVGFLAFVMTGIGYWPNLISRIGLRFPLYPLFAAPALYYLIRGLRYQKRNDFILSGLFLGLGLQGYTPARIVPFIFVVLIGLYLLHHHAHAKRGQVLVAFGMLILTALVIFLPLGRYATENWQMFDYRTLTRLGSTETPLPGSVVDIFVSNTWKAWIMPFWDDGETWVHSVVHRPSLDVVAAALYFLGSLQVFIRYLHKRHWIDLFLLVSVPLFMAPSILSLAFPNENPSLNRTGAAYILVFIMAAIALEGILSSIRRLANQSRTSTVLAGVLGLALIGWSAANNNYLVQTKFDNQFMEGAWNTSQIGAVIRGFADSIGTEDTAYVVPYPYWVDTRLVGINAGYPTKDYALNRDQISTTLDNPLAKLFIFKPEDKDTETLLKQLYPSGAEVLHTSPYLGKDFEVYSVPAVVASGQP